MKIKISKSQWELIGQNNGWTRKAFLSSSENMSPELEKDLKKLAISYNNKEIEWNKVTSEIINMTRDNPKLKDIALNMVVDFVTRLTQSEQKKQQVMASKK